jgi:PKD repeat protein
MFPEPRTVQFTDQSTGGVTSWLWNFGDGYTSNVEDPIHYYRSNGSYSVTLSVTGLGCEDSLTKKDYIRVGVTPTPTAPPTSSLCHADFSAYPTELVGVQEVQFTDNSIGTITSWKWDFGDGYNSSEKNPAHFYSSNGVYSVTLSVTGQGCEDTVTKQDYIQVTGCHT